MKFQLIHEDAFSRARSGIIFTSRGSFNTPVFMPVGTQGTVKAMSPEELQRMEVKIILCNTYHLYLRPGWEVIKNLGGLHKFINWPGPILTDSGGYQIFSISSLQKPIEDGVIFKSHIDGSEHFLTPEQIIDIQLALDSDIMMVLDECTEYPCTKKRARRSMELTLHWAWRCRQRQEKLKKGNTMIAKQASQQLLFGIVQGSTYQDLRQKCVKELVAMNFDGYALGGVSVGENIHTAYKVLDWVFADIPYDKPRYVMGMGMPKDIIEAVKRGVDMFDCVIPTREGRHGRLFLWKRNSKLQIPNNKEIPNYKFQITKNFYNTISITRARFAKDMNPINSESKLPELRQYSKAFLHYLFKIGEPLGQRLASLNNLEFYFDLMEKIRYSIRSGKL